MKKRCSILIMFLYLFISGCASVSGGSSQSLTVMANHKDQDVVGANCEIKNTRGLWFVTTPGTTQIRSSNETLSIVCNKKGLESGRAIVESETKGAMYGNLILGGVIGGAVDHSTGAAYEYPKTVRVRMGFSTKISGSQGVQSVTLNQNFDSIGNNLNITEATKIVNSPNSFDTQLNNSIRSKCIELGFKPQTDRFDKCIQKFSR